MSATLTTMRPIPTAPIAAGSFVVSYAVVASTGSRALGGVVLLAGAAWCARTCMRRRDSRTAAELVGVGLIGFISSHLLALAIGAWPAVLLVAAAVGVTVWMRADSPRLARAGAI